MLKELIIVSEFHGHFLYSFSAVRIKGSESFCELSSQQKGPKLGVIFYCLNSNKLMKIGSKIKELIIVSNFTDRFFTATVF